MKLRHLVQSVCAAGLLVGIAIPAIAQVRSDAGTPDRDTAAQVFKKPPYSPYAGRSFPTRVFWGDTHLHTSISLDAGAVGATLGPEASYRFARGDEVTSASGQSARLARPLDFPCRQRSCRSFWQHG